MEELEMKKLNLGTKPILYPMPVVLVGAHVGNKATFMTVAYCGVVNAEPPMISVSIRPSRFTSAGIKENRHFSVNVPTVDMAREVDYCGLFSGSSVDKVAACKFELFYGHLASAPMIKQCPVTHCCTVAKVIELGTHELIIGKIEETFMSDDCMTNDKPDVAKIKPLVFITGTEALYAGLGNTVGHAFKDGTELKK
jgi:flavin reductase (DIM6/NTAB) family NADH-FMN oxidoreductase RutF